MGQIKKDCCFYRKSKCDALKHVECAIGNCSFYKTENIEPVKKTSEVVERVRATSSAIFYTKKER